ARRYRVRSPRRHDASTSSRQVSSPTSPSTTSPRRSWNVRTAATVVSPNRPSSSAAAIGRSRPSKRRWMSRTAPERWPGLISIGAGAPSGLPLGDELGELAEDLLLAARSDEPPFLHAVDEQEHRRDRKDAEPARRFGVRVDVELRDRQFAGLLGSDLFEDRCDHVARSAPLGPEVDDDGDG